MMRSCVIWILSFNLYVCLAAEAPQQHAALSIDYVSSQRPLSAVLDHCQSFAHIQSSIDTPLLKLNISNAPVEIILNQANQSTTLQAICHSLEQDVWWYRDQHNNILFTHASAEPFDRQITNKIYHSNVNNPKETHQHLLWCLAPWLQVPKSGLGYIPANRQWSASLTKNGHQQLKRLLHILEQQSSNIPVLASTELKRVLPLTEAINCTNWSDAAALMQRQLKCSVSINRKLIGIKKSINIPACMPEQLPQHLHKLGAYAGWVDGVLCLGDRAIQSWQHPAMCKSVIIPMHQFSPNQQAEIIEMCKERTSVHYWNQAGCQFIHLKHSNSYLVMAHSSVITRLLDIIQNIDSNPRLP